MAIVIRSPAVAKKARVLSSKDTKSHVETSLPQSDEYGHDKEHPGSESSDDLVAYRKISMDKVEQLYSQYKSEQQVVHEQPDANYEEVLRQRAKIQDLEQELAELTESIEQLKAEAAKEGFDQGYEEGKAASLESFNGSLKAMEQIVKDMQESRQNMLASQEDTMVEVIAAAVGKIVGGLYSTEEGTVASIRSAIKQTMQRDKLILRVSPDDFDDLNKHKQDLFAGIEEGAAELVADENIKYGGCILESSAGSVDKRLEVQMQLFLDTLARVRKHRRSLDS